MDTARHAFTEDFTIYQAAELKARILAALDGGERIEFDLAGVERIDTAGCQLLILARREALKAGKTFAIVAHSSAVQALIEFYHLAAWFGDPIVVPAATPREE